MDPMTAGMIGMALGKGGGGASRQTSQQTLSNSIGISTPNTNTYGASFSVSPTIANMIGAGSTVAPATGGASTPQTVAPYVDNRASTSSSPSLAANDGSGGGSLPFSTRSLTPGGFGPSYGRPPAQQPMDDLLLLLLIGGGAVLLLMQS